MASISKFLVATCPLKAAAASNMRQRIAQAAVSLKTLNAPNATGLGTRCSNTIDRITSQLRIMMIREMTEIRW
jgi:hypothetical protein